MINKLQQYTPSGANQDISKSKHSNEFYYDAQHIRIIATDGQTTGNVTNEKGNVLKVSFPNISIDTVNKNVNYDGKSLKYTNDEINQQISSGTLNRNLTKFEIIANCVTRNSVILFTTSTRGNCIWELENILEEDSEYELNLLYIRNLDFSKDFPIQTLFNFENENIQKVYWVDGNNQLRFINIKHEQIKDNSKTIDIPITNLNLVGNINFSQPTITEIIGGGTHTAGMIQYSYNLYNLNGSQTKISPLSRLIPLDKIGNNAGGGEINEIIGSTPKIKISNIDKNYTHIKIYAIKYTSYGQIPSISLINESEIDSNNFIYYDSGSVIENISLSEFLFLGSDPTIPKHIESKDNRLFLSNIKTKNFLIPDELDTRAYSFSSNSSTTFVYDQVTKTSPNGNVLNGISKRGVTSDYNIPLKHSSINGNFIENNRQYNSTKLGGEGKYIKYELIESPRDLDDKSQKVFKDEELYRIGLKFYNRLGQSSLPKWIADFKTPPINLSTSNNYYKLKVSLKPEFFIWLNSYQFESVDDKPIGFKVLRAAREDRDKTILCQGTLNSMMYQVKGDESRFNKWSNYSERLDYQDQSVKLPGYISRGFRTFPNNIEYNKNVKERLGKTKHGFWIGGFRDNNLNQSSYEIAHGNESSSTFLHTAMMQMFSPEILFNPDLTFSNGLKIKTKGKVVNTKNGLWGQELIINSNLPKFQGKIIGTGNNSVNDYPSGEKIKAAGALNPWFLDPSEYQDDQGFRNVFTSPDTASPHGYILSSGNADESYVAAQWYRQYNNFYKGSNKNYYEIYGTPEITEEGNEAKNYNNDGRFQYKNNLRGFLVGGDAKTKLLDIQSNNSKCLTIVLNDKNNIKTENRILLEDLYRLNDTRSNDNNVELNSPFNNNALLISEITRDPSYTYFGNIYNGNSFEEKKRTTYIEIGNYTGIDIANGSLSSTVDSPGDTFVQNFKFLKMGRTEQKGGTSTSQIISEIVEFPVETQINLKNRNDLSLSTWDSEFLPLEQNYHQYNRVYSQAPTLLKSNDVDFTFKRINEFDSRIQSTKLKIPNESIDSWTDILVNETMDLDGKYGPINSIITFKNKMYAFQDESIAAVLVNPRVQVQGNDGLSLELGKGNILYDYDYLTTSSGAVNKWGITKGKRGIYYYDLLNKGVGRVPDSIQLLLSDSKGFHSWFNNNYNYNDLNKDNPLLNKGVVFGSDIYNNDIYMTLLQGDKSFTRVFNENVDQFIDLKTYLPAFYINKGNKLFSNIGNNIYEHNIGEYNKFLGKYEESFITLVVNPNSNQDTVFNNIFYNSEVYLNDIDQPKKTLTHIQAYNEYQNSGKIPLEIGRNKNLRRKFREWKANIPRENRNRIRNPWIFLKLSFENTSNYKLVLHDIIVSYTV